MKLNFPIKYALLPIFYAEEERDYRLMGYITSKCYLLGEEIVYAENGSKKRFYNIVFPYELRHGGNWCYQIPTYYKDGNPNNSRKVDRIYNDFFTAENAERIKNYQIAHRYHSGDVVENNEIITEEMAEKYYQKWHKYYSQIKQEMLDSTSNLEPRELFIKNDIIMKKDSYQIVDDTFYNHLEEASVVRSLPEVGYLALRDSILNENMDLFEEIILQSTPLMVKREDESWLLFTISLKYYILSNGLLTAYSFVSEEEKENALRNVSYDAIYTKDNQIDVLETYKEHEDIKAYTLRFEK